MWLNVHSTVRLIRDGGKLGGGEGRKGTFGLPITQRDVTTKTIKRWEANMGVVNVSTVARNKVTKTVCETCAEYNHKL